MIAAGIDYTEAGTGPTVICLHGIGGGCDSFLAQMPVVDGFAPPLASRQAGGRCPPAPPQDIYEQKKGAGCGLAGYRVISWNMPGYGGSVAGHEPLDFASLSRALARFIAALGPGSVHLVGQSIGGMIALDHALRCPDQVATLSLIGTTPSFGGRDPGFSEAFLSARLAPLEAGQTMAEMAADSAPRIVGPAADAATIAQISAIMAQVSEQTWRGILNCLVTFNRRADLARVQQPCCLIAGSHDQNAPARTMEKMAAILPAAEYHLIEGAGHMINQEAPAQTNAILMEFLGKNTI